MTSEQLQVVKELTLAAIDKMKFPSSMNLKEYNDGVVTEICDAFKKISKTVTDNAMTEKLS